MTKPAPRPPWPPPATLLSRWLPSTLPAGRVVDLGCGDGAWSAAAGRLTGRPVFAVDTRAGAVAAAQGACRGLAVRGVVAPAEASGLPSGSAAVVLCVRLLGFVTTGEEVLAEAVRLLASGGLLVVADWDDVPAPTAPEGLVLEPLFAPPGGWALAGRHGAPTGPAAS